MNATEIKKGMQGLNALQNFNLGHHPGFYYFSKSDERSITTIGFGYSDFSPKYQFNGITVGIKLLEIENILEPLVLKHMNQDLQGYAFNYTVTTGEFFSDQFRSQGVTNDNELIAFIDEFDQKVNQFAFPWIKSNGSLEEIKNKLQLLSIDDQIAYLGQSHALYRRLIIAHQLQEADLYAKYKEEAKNNFEKLINRKARFQNLMDLLLELSDILESNQAQDNIS